MALAPGDQIGPYQVNDPIGSGGMGQVYRATDMTLEREVAIKVLPDSFSTDADWVARFEREAKTLAALNHPNIAHVYGLERGDGVTALVMELVEGPTLADRIADGPLPADEALGVAMQIAGALEAAHSRGIVHRDLKPANIKLKPDGTVKVLDFGIAKTLDIQAASGRPAPAMTTPAMTQTGIILGTAAYMSPEQARGKPIDQRTDIWAFGCLLYEMLTGQPAFAGEDVAITLARILANDTDMNSLPGMISPSVRQTIELCLKKDAGKRIADIRDVRLALEGAFDTVSPHAVAGAPHKSAYRRALPYAAAVLLALLVGVGAGLQQNRPQTVAPAVTRFYYEFPEGQTLRNTAQHVLAVSADGRQFVYNTTRGLYLRALGELQAHIIPGTEPTLSQPVFSPDGLAVAYWEGSGQLKRISVNGGGVVSIAQISDIPNGMSWSREGTILYCGTDGVMRVAATGGTPEFVTSPSDGSQCYSPALLPDGDSILFSTSDASGGPGSVVVQSLSTGAEKVLVESGGDARYVSTGHLIYMVGGSLFAVAFDLDELRVSGGAVPLVQGVMQLTNAGLAVGAADYDVSDNGTLVYIAGALTTDTRTLAWVSRQGGEEELGLPARTYASPRLSPDRTKLAINARDQELDIWVWDVLRKTMSRLTVDPGNDRFPVWSRDGSKIYFSSTRNRTGQQTSLYWKAADSTGQAEKIVDAEAQLFPTSVLPGDTGVLAYGARSGLDDNDDLMVVELNDQAQVKTLLNSGFGESMPEISPDGSLLAYVSDETGRQEVYVSPFPDIESGGRRQQVSTEGGTEPLWSADGSELFYLTNEGALMTVPVQREPFELGAPQQLLNGQFVMNIGNGGGRSYDVSLDGERFLVIRPAGGTRPTAHIVVEMNWSTELERLVPTD